MERTGGFLRRSLRFTVCIAGAGWILAAGSFMLCAAAASKGSGESKSQVESILTGKKTWKEWQTQTDWDSYSAETYRPSRDKLKKIGRLAQARKARFLVFAGSWCKDSEAHLPALMKVLNRAGISARDVELYGVDGNLTEPSGTARLHGIVTVPTILILSGEDELGRVVERPSASWEEDILEILSRK
ncbi:MAG: hypothetical protein GX443_02010 [Deltaproteobacteria bacterium]|nr:hypothetical protein [Deltaproteobacteria bacterium]